MKKLSSGTWVAITLVILGVAGAVAGLKWRKLEPQRIPPATVSDQ